MLTSDSSLHSLATLEILAQAPPPSNNPPEAPFGTMVSLLLLGGGAYAIRELNGTPEYLSCYKSETYGYNVIM